MGDPIIGKEIVGIRQKCAGLFASNPPKKGAVFYAADKFVSGMYDYVDPDDYTKDIADTGQAGQFFFGPHTVFLYEMRVAIGANNFSASLKDAGGSPDIVLLTAQSGNSLRYAFDPPLPVLPAASLCVTSLGGSGSVTVYAVKGDAVI